MLNCSWVHEITNSIADVATRALGVRYSLHFFFSVLTKRLAQKRGTQMQATREEAVVVLFFHIVSHNLMAIAHGFGVKVVFQNDFHLSCPT